MHNNSHTETNKESASDWLLRVGPLAKRLNEESMGDLAAPTVAGGPADLSRSASQPKALIDYREGGGQ
jgi:hypothetical protein